MEFSEVSPLRIAFLVGSLLCLVSAWTFGCSRGDIGADDSDRRPKADATARLAPSPGGDAHGFVRFVQDTDGVHVIAELAGLPAGEHAFHVHETGSCQPPDFVSAGERFSGRPAPDRALGGKNRGLSQEEKRHAGDLGNIVVGDDGTASVDRNDLIIALEGGRSIIGRALIVHAARDTNEGARILCGVIERADLTGEKRNIGAEHRLPDGKDDAVDFTQPRDRSIPPLSPPMPIP